MVGRAGTQSDGTERECGDCGPATFSITFCTVLQPPSRNTPSGVHRSRCSRPHHLTGPAPSVWKRHRTPGRRVQPRVKGTRPTPRQGAGQRMLGEPTEPSSITQVPGLPVSRGHGSSHHSDISFCSCLPRGY